MNRETEMQKPTHKTYENDRNILYPEPYNAGLDEMEAYYQPLLGECLGALREIKRISHYIFDGEVKCKTTTQSLIYEIATQILAKRKGEIQENNPKKAPAPPPLVDRWIPPRIFTKAKGEK